MSRANTIKRVTAALAAVGCMVVSLKLVGDVFVHGMVIGAWTGLSGYEQAIRAAEARANKPLLYLLAVQLFGGVLTFVAGRGAHGVVWFPVFAAAFSALTLLLAVVMLS